MANSAAEDPNLDPKERKRRKKEKKRDKKHKKTQDESQQKDVEEETKKIDDKSSKQDRKEKKRKKKEKKKRKRKESQSSSEVSSDDNEKPAKRSKANKTKDGNKSSESDSESTQDTGKKMESNDDPRIVESFGPEQQSQENGITLMLFYQYVEPIWSLDKYKQVLKDMEKLGKSLQLTGRMRVAREGLNCTLTSTNRSRMLEFCQTLRQQPEFQTTEFKLTHDLPEAQKFPHLKVIEVIELVHYGLEGEKAPPIKNFHGVHLEPKDYHQKIAEENTVMIDVRNHYEAIIGHFQPPNKDAWLDPMMRKSTEFPVWLDKPETKEKLKGKQVLMYCTGGIRCER